MMASGTAIGYVQWTAFGSYRVEDGKVADEWAAGDPSAILHDIGVCTPPWLS